MKKFTILLTSIFIISACSQSDNQNQAETSDAPPSLIEYVWHKAGSDFSEDNLSMLINSWNGMIDDAMRAMMAMATTLLIGLIYPQSFKDYDTFATLQTMRIELPQDEGRFFFALLEQRNIS